MPINQTNITAILMVEGTAMGNGMQTVSTVTANITVVGLIVQTRPVHNATTASSMAGAKNGVNLLTGAVTLGIAVAVVVVFLVLVIKRKRGDIRKR